MGELLQQNKSEYFGQNCEYKDFFPVLRIVVIGKVGKLGMDVSDTLSETGCS